VSVTHLSDVELLGTIEGETGAAAHLSACEVCRNRVEELRCVLERTRSVDVPEPSPLFWDHFSDRVRQAIAGEGSPVPLGWRPRFGWAASLVGALAIVVIAVALMARTDRPPARQLQVADSSGAVESHSVGEPPALAPLGDESTWALMGELMSQMSWEEARSAGLIARPGSAAQALSQMTEEEQRQVVEALRRELQNTNVL
jgi:hypothetical protein